MPMCVCVCVCACVTEIQFITPIKFKLNLEQENLEVFKRSFTPAE